MNDDLRRSSVYDLTSLRLHPDGLRVHQRERKLGDYNYKTTIQNSQRRWIADDAGGSYEVPVRHPKRLLLSPSEGRDVELEEVEEGESEEEEKSASGNGKRKQKRKNSRPNKKRKFTKDESYLSTPPRHGSLETLSQDLLKNIHQFAAKYYDEQGLLLDASRGHRRAKKIRKLRLLPGSASENPRSSQDLPEEGRSASDSEQVPEENNGQRKRVTRDMYRVLDGSVLLAVGVLTQELVKKLIGAKRPRKTTRALPSDEEDPVEDYEGEEDVKPSSLRHDGRKEVDEEEDDESEDEGP